MHIVLINHYAGSPHHGMEYRPYYMAREWIACGHQVSILAGSYSHVRRLNPVTALRQEVIDGISYHWFPTSLYSGNGIGRFRNMLQFVGGICWASAGLAAQLRPDVVIASSTYPLDIIAARRLNRLAKGKLIFEIHDLWPLSPIQIGGMSPKNPFVALMGWAEGRALRDAHQVVSMLPYTKSYLLSRGMAANKFHYVPNGFYPTEWEAAAEPLDGATRQRLSDMRSKFPFLVGYAGSHGAANALQYHVAAAARLHGHGIGLVLVGHGPEKAALEKMTRSNRSDNVLFLDPLPKRQIPGLLREFDAAYIGWRALSLYRHGVSPNKLFDYMMAERPIVHAIDAETNQVEEAGCGLTVPAENEQALAEAYIKLSKLPLPERQEMGRRGRDYAMKNHDYRVLARRFEQVMGSP